MSTPSSPHQGAIPEHIRVSNISGLAAKDVSTTSGRRHRLETQDSQFGPLRIGEFTISRVELYEMGARINGRPVSTHDTPAPSPDQNFINSLQLDPVSVQARASHNEQLAGVLFELATRRAPSAQSLLLTVSPELPSPVYKLGSLLDSAQQLSLSPPILSENLPDWVDRLKSRSMTSMGVGMQAYGIYSGIMGTVDALKKDDTLDASINASGVFAEMSSLLVERGLEKTGHVMIQNGAQVFKGFSATSAGKWLARSTGLIASAITLPFDLYTAIKSFNDAATATGKTAQDLYFNGALSLTSAGLSLALGTAALAGFGAAGPVGLVAGALLILGARIYGAARQVDDIDDYIALSTHERWRSGWFAFTGQALDTDVMDRYLIARTDANYRQRLTQAARGWLDGELKDSVEAVVLGNYQIELQPAKHWKLEWDAAAGERPYTDVKEPVVKETDDVYDARQGLDAIPGVITGTTAQDKAIFWQLGGGNDRVVGVKDKPNYFLYGAGGKQFTGGDKDDQFIFQSADSLLDTKNGADSHLHGGAGSDTLQLLGNASQDTARRGFHIDLENGTLSLRANPDRTPVTLESIENVETLAGASSHVTGSAQANRIVLRGTDERTNAGAGDDQLHVRGFDCHVNGEAGIDRYTIADATGTTTITEDGQDESLIEMGWAFERIQTWHIDGTALVMTALHGPDGELPQTCVTIRGVYRQLADKRELKNDKLLFVTRDGYSLKADLPQHLDGHGTTAINVIILKAGPAKPAPPPLKGGEYSIPATPDASYFLCRHQPSTVLNVQGENDTLTSTLHVGYDSHEIEAVDAGYTVTSTRVGNFDYLNYHDVDLTLRFTDQKQLTFKHLARNRSSVGTHVGGSLRASGMMLNHGFILIMRDGESFRLKTPEHSYVDDHRHPGRKRVEARRSLGYRAGKYLLAQPAYYRAIVLGTQAQRVDIDPVPQSAIYLLQGQASTYDIYPAADTLLRLSTPGAASKTSNASHWNIHTQHLSEQIEHPHIRLTDSQLRIGNINVLLPDVDDPDVALETLHIFTSSGHRYDIDLAFGLVYWAQVEGRAYASPEALLSELRQHQRTNAPMAELLPLRHLRLNDGKAAALYYDGTTQNLTVEGDWSRTLDATDVYIVPMPPAPDTVEP